MFYIQKKKNFFFKSFGREVNLSELQLQRMSISYALNGLNDSMLNKQLVVVHLFVGTHLCIQSNVEKYTSLRCYS